MPRIVTLCVWLALLAALGARAAPSPAPAPESRGPDFLVTHPGDKDAPPVQLVGLTINGVDSGQTIAVQIWPSGAVLVAVGMLCKVLNLPSERVAEGWTITTPIGVGRLVGSVLSRRDDVDYAAADAIESSLGVGLEFDSAESSLNASVGWLALTAPPQSTRDTVTPVIDIHAPRASLSEWRTELQAHNTSVGTDINTLTELGGSLGPGNWRLRYSDDIEGRRSVDEWGWLLDKGRNRWYLGEQQVALDTLLPSISLTGAQWAYTNRPEAIYGNDVAGNQLVASRISARRIIQGDGPPGGIAELRADNRVIARTLVRLDGRFRFPELNFLAANARLEVALFRPASNDVPVRVYQVTNRASDELLPDGTYVIHSGFGRQDNPLDPNDPKLGNAGFATARVGVTPRLSIDASVQRAFAHDYMVAGATTDLGKAGTWSARFAQSNNAAAMGLLGEGHSTHAFWTASLRRFEAGYGEDASPMRHDYLAEAGWQTPRLRLSLIGRDFADPSFGERRYLKPALSAQPWKTVTVSAYPDYLGRYNYAVGWQPTDRMRLSAASYERRRQVDWQQTLSDQYTLTTAVVTDGDFGSRQSSVLYRRPNTRYGLAWGVGVLHGNGRFGYLADAGLELRPGLTARAQIQNDPLYSNSSVGTRSINLIITADFSIAGGTLTRGSFNPERRRVGAILAHIDRKSLSNEVAIAELAGVGILIDGQVRSVLDKDGSVRIDGLPPGVHQVSLDLENLPLELSPLNGPRNVEVRAGSTTEVLFGLDHTSGCAGRVGVSAAGWIVRALGPDGQIVASAPVNAIGFYRLDGLKPASYRLELVDMQQRIRATRTLLLGDHFSMDVNLAIDPVPPESTP